MCSGAVPVRKNNAFQKANAEGKKVSFKAWLGGAMAIKEDNAPTLRLHLIHI